MITREDHRGWEVVRLSNAEVEAVVVPGKGGDVLSLVHRSSGTDVLWKSPWGLRHKGAVPTAATPDEQLIESYPGGWQTVFPNAGDPCSVAGATWGAHGEAWLAPFDVEEVADGIRLRTRLVRSPFQLTKTVRLCGSALLVEEEVHHQGGTPLDVAWGQHPAFGGAFLDETAMVDVPAGAVLVDTARDTPAGDLERGARSSWPFAPSRSGTGDVDLRRLPESTERLAYLSGLAEGRGRIVNQGSGLCAELRWDAAELPYAWYWLESSATPGFPWFEAVRVFALEPFSSWPAAGLERITEVSGTQLRIEPGERRSTTLQISLQD